jgi:NADPH:quinone reductase-like Zn-dependent oxidoreductase
MRAVRFERYGDADVLDIVEVDKPAAGDGQVVVAVRAAGINPGETKIRTGELADRFPANFPEGQGSDFAGVVDAVGPGVMTFAVGDEVLGYTNDRASHAEFVGVGADQIVGKPAALDWARAGAMFVAGTSAYALARAAEVASGDVVVVSAAAGGVGSLTVQWARHLGASVVGLASPRHHDWLRSLGVQPVDYAGDGLAGRVRDVLDGARVSALLDTFGEPYVQLGFDLGVDPRRIATIATFTAGERGATVVQHFRVATPQVLTELAQALADGTVQMPVAATYPLVEVRDAYRELEQGHTHGKIVLLP